MQAAIQSSKSFRWLPTVIGGVLVFLFGCMVGSFYCSTTITLRSGTRQSIPAVFGRVPGWLQNSTNPSGAVSDKEIGDTQGLMDQISSPMLIQSDSNANAASSASQPSKIPDSLINVVKNAAAATDQRRSGILVETPLDPTLDVPRVNPLPLYEPEKFDRHQDLLQQQLSMQIYNVPNSASTFEIGRRKYCQDMMRDHHVIPGISWGVLPESRQGEWTQKGCDAEATDSMYADLYNKTEERDLATDFLVKQRRVESRITARLDACTREGRCPWLQDKKKITIVLARWEEDVQWLGELDRNRFDVVLYSRLGSADENPGSEYYVPHNFGEEAAIYLHYILTHYDTGNFSEWTVFGHAHRTSWHQQVRSFPEKVHSFHYDYYPFMELQWNEYYCIASPKSTNPPTREDAAWYMWIKETYQYAADPEVPWYGVRNSTETAIQSHRFDEEPQGMPPKNMDPDTGRGTTLASDEKVLWPATKQAVAAMEETRSRLAKKRQIPEHRFNPGPLTPMPPAPNPPTLRSRIVNNKNIITTVCDSCCAQFSVHRSRILAQPKQLYQETYDRFWGSKRQYNVLESTWHMLFGELPQTTKLTHCQYSQSDCN